MLLLEKNTNILQSLLASLLYLPTESVKDIQIVSPYAYIQSVVYDATTLVLYATIDNEPKIQIKIHFAKEHLSQEDNLLYDGQSHGFIHIEIVDFDLFSKAQEEFYTRLTMVNTKSGKSYVNQFQLNILQLNQVAHATKKDMSHNLHLWARFFKATTWEEIKMLAKEHILFAECAQTMNDIMKNEAQFFYLQSRIRCERMRATEKAQLAEANAERDEAFNERDEALAKLSEKIAEIERIKAQLMQQGISAN